MQVVQLKEILRKNRFYFKRLSIDLDQGKIKLDCSQVEKLNNNQLKALFAHIKSEWKSWDKLDKFIEMKTLKSEDLRLQIKKFLDSPPHPRNWQMIIIPIGIIGAIAIVIGGKILISNGKIITCENTNYTRQYSPTNLIGKCYKNLTKTPLTIGILTEAKYYEKFKEYLSNQLGASVKDVRIESVDQCYEVARDKIARKDWDIAFTYSPMNSMAASDNGYTWIARMFPERSEYYQSALYTKKNSPINSKNDIKPSHKIAFGCITSASSFYMPIYGLYGKTINVSINHRNIKDLVRNGIVDVGAGSASFIDESQFKIIDKSHDIPGTGVYISPEISPEIQQRIKTLMDNVPPDIKQEKEANYGKGNEPDWTQFRKIAAKAEAIIQCKNLEQNPVKLYGCQCPSPQVKSGIEGQVNGFVKINAQILQLNVDDAQGNTYYLQMEPKILSQVPNGSTPILIKGKKVIIQNIKPKSMKSNLFEIKITDSKQIQVLDGCS